MIAVLKGVLAARLEDAAVVDVNGVGYLVGMSGNSLAALPEPGESVQVHTYLQVREDALALYGFATEKEKALFERLIGVSGVGPKVALSALGSYKPSELAHAIMTGDVKAVSTIPGIGKKTAQRIILELQGVLTEEAPGQGEVALQKPEAAKQTLEDLLAMGFTSTEADLALRDAPADATERELLQYALKRLGA